MLKNFVLLFSCISLLGFSQTPKEDGLYAEINTSKGKILLQLAYDKAPVTVANFVSLAEGENDFVEDKYKGKPYYNGLKFHRVIPNFMIQGGDPTGTGASGPGYKFTDEFSDLLHDGPGVLSMANAGPGTNGSQFFITHKETPWLNGKHTVFGKVIEGQDVVDAIAQGDVMESVNILRVGKDAKRFKADKVFEDYVTNKTERDKEIALKNNEAKKAIDAKIEAIKKEQAEKAEAERKAHEAKYAAVCQSKKEYFATQKAKATTLPSGLQYLVVEKGNGVKPENGTKVAINYSGFFENGQLFDSSFAEVAKEFGKYDEKRAQANAYKPLPTEIGSKNLINGFSEGLTHLNYGDKAILFIPSNLAYGEKGAGNVIPPNANIIFEVEISE